MTNKKISVTYYPTTDEVFMPLGLKQHEYWQEMSKIMKKLQVLSKNAKNHDGKKLKNISLPLETKQKSIIKPHIKT